MAETGCGGGQREGQRGSDKWNAEGALELDCLGHSLSGYLYAYLFEKVEDHDIMDRGAEARRGC